MSLSPPTNACSAALGERLVADPLRAAEGDEVRDRVGAHARRQAPRGHVLEEVRGHEVLEDRAQGRDAGRDADLPEGRVDPGRHPRPLRLDDADGGRGERRVDEPDPAAGEQEAREQRGPVVAGLEAAHQPQPDADERQPGAQEPADPEALGELARDRRDQEGQQRDRQEAQAGFERRVAEDVLDVEREVEEHREHRRRQHERRDRRAGEGGLARTARDRASGARCGARRARRRSRGPPRPRGSRRSAGRPSPRRCRGSARR